MRIGIVTIYESVTNMGSYLQAFALKTVLEEMGHDVFFVQKTPTLQTIKKCIFRINPKREFLLRIGKAICFARDVKRLKLIRSDEIEEKHIDLLIYGSDEIWNLDNPYFLDPLFWGHGHGHTKKIAYAVSIGAMSDDTVTQNQALCAGMENFSKIMVRDVRTHEFVESQIGVNASYVCDPTILAPLKSYIVRGNIPAEPYLLVYTYGVDRSMEQIIVNFARKNNLKIVSPCFWHTWADRVIECSALELSSLMAGAQYVFTSTFHGAIFTLLNHKQCCIYPYREKVYDVTKRLGEEERIIQKNCDEEEFERIMSIPFDSQEFEDRIDIIRNESLVLLKEALEC